MLASLPMYRYPWLINAHNLYWSAIRKRLLRSHIRAPRSLAQPADDLRAWLAPTLVLSQTCSLPYRLFLRGRVRIIGTPDYGLSGCPAGYYYSVIVVHKTNPAVQSESLPESLPDNLFNNLPAHMPNKLPENLLDNWAHMRFACNDRFSQSGYAALMAFAAHHGVRCTHMERSGSHLRSAQMVASGRADAAALDAVSWRHIARHIPFAKHLRVAAATAITPGLPCISAMRTKRRCMFRALSAAVRDVPQGIRTQLGIRGFVYIPPSLYQTLPVPAELQQSKRFLL